jgi:acyl-homoserine lactone acylase PvdQ
LYYGAGYAEAQDRLWAIHLKKMMFLGRTSEMFGTEVYPMDKYIRNLNIAAVGRKNVQMMDE